MDARRKAAAARWAGLKAGCASFDFDPEETFSLSISTAQRGQGHAPTEWHNTLKFSPTRNWQKPHTEAPVTVTKEAVRLCVQLSPALPSPYIETLPGGDSLAGLRASRRSFLRDARRGGTARNGRQIIVCFHFCSVRISSFFVRRGEKVCALRTLARIFLVGGRGASSEIRCVNALHLKKRTGVF